MLTVLQSTATDEEVIFLDAEMNFLDSQTLNTTDRLAIEAHAGRLAAEYQTQVRVAVVMQLTNPSELNGTDSNIPFLGEPIAPPPSHRQWQEYGLTATEVA